MTMKFHIVLMVIILGASQGYSQLPSGEKVFIEESIHRDLYITGGTVTINAPIDGDLIAAGGTIIVNDTIAQDILVAGGNIVINGVVGDDIRCAGGSIQISGSVSGDLIATGGTIEIGKKAVISGDVLATGGQLSVDGVVKGSFKGASETLALNGTIEKDVEFKGDQLAINGAVGGASTLVANSIEIGQGARFSKDVTYWSNSGLIDFRNSLEASTARFDSSLELDQGKWHYLGFASFVMVIWYLATAFVMILLLEYLFSKTLRKSADTIKNRSLMSLGTGFLFLIAGPISIVILFLSVIAIPVGLLLLIGYLVVVLLATVIVALLISNWINNTFYQSTWSRGAIVMAAFGFFIFLKLASLTPVIGPMIMLILACMSFGGVLLNVKGTRNKRLVLT